MGLDADAGNRLEDLSGLVLQPGENPYAAFIKCCHDDPKEIQSLYSVHRTRRNAQQREKFLASDFKGLSIDQTILKLERPHLAPGFRDERHCLVLWARPPEHILLLASRLQDMLREAAPGLWLMPLHRMHMTVLEVAFSKTAEEIAALTSVLRGSIPAITSHTYVHRARLVKPLVSYDTSAIAMSFLPASGEESLSPAPTSPGAIEGHDDAYTHHHLRRDVFDMVQAAGLQVGSRYQVPSAHVTLGRFLDEADHDTPQKRERWIAVVEQVNRWLEREVWGRREGGGGAGLVAEWIVGQERGLDARCGTLWYGGGRTILLGEGF